MHQFLYNKQTKPGGAFSSGVVCFVEQVKELFGMDGDIPGNAIFEAQTALPGGRSLRGGMSGIVEGVSGSGGAAELLWVIVRLPSP